MNEIIPEWKRYMIEESLIREHDRQYLNYLEAARVPITVTKWSDFANIELDFLMELVDHYKIPMVNSDDLQKVLPIEILNTSKKNVNTEIALDSLQKWKMLKEQKKKDLK